MAGKMRLFAGNSHLAFARKLALELGVPLHEPDESDSKGPMIKWFSNGNCQVSINTNVRDSHCFVVQTQAFGRALLRKDEQGRDVFGVNLSVSDMIMETLLLCDALREAGARVTVVMPYMPYIRSDKKDHARNSIGAQLLMDLLAEAGASRLLIMEPHFDQIHGFSKRGILKVETLNMKPIFAMEILRRSGLEAIMVAPDIGEAKHLAPFARNLGLDAAIINKDRPRDDEEVIAQQMIGNVLGRHTQMIDDETMSCSTLLMAADFCQEEGALSMDAAIAHPVLSVPEGIQKVQAHPLIRELLVTDTIPIAPKNQIPKLRVVSVVPHFAEAMRRMASTDDEDNSVDAYKVSLYAKMDALLESLRPPK
jgi:ribose-phosphate pyrophosphokinase